MSHSAAHHRLWPRQIVETDDEVDNNNVDDDNVEDDNDAGDDNIDNNNNIDDNVNDNDEVGDDKWGEDEMDDNDNLDNEADEDEEPPRKCARRNSTRHDASRPSFVSIWVYGLMFWNVPSSIFVFGWLTIAHFLNVRPIFLTHNVLSNRL